MLEQPIRVFRTAKGVAVGSITQQEIINAVNAAVKEYSAAHQSTPLRQAKIERIVASGNFDKSELETLNDNVLDKLLAMTATSTVQNSTRLFFKSPGVVLSEKQLTDTAEYHQDLNEWRVQGVRRSNSMHTNSAFIQAPQIALLPADEKL